MLRDQPLLQVGVGLGLHFVQNKSGDVIFLSKFYNRVYAKNMGPSSANLVLTLNETQYFLIKISTDQKMVCTLYALDVTLSFLMLHYLLFQRGPGGSMSQIVGSNNSYKPITNTAWVRARLCKLQKGSTRLAAACDKV